MLDPRIYRAGFAAVALAVVVVAFSLVDQQGALGSNLAPDAFSGQNALSQMNRLMRADPDRTPGSPGDGRVADAVAGKLRAYGFQVRRTTFTGRTAAGKRTLVTITGVRTGLTPGTIAIVSHRDGTGPAALSGTGALIDLARVLAGETPHRTIVLASVTGSAGDAGATELARDLPGPVDAVLTLGDLATAGPPHGPVVIPWSTASNVAPPVLRNTVAAALTSQAGLAPGGAGIAGQLEHLALPLTLSEQGPFGALGIPAVTLSLSGDHPAPAQEAVSPARLGALGRTALQTLTALDAGPNLPRAQPYLLLSGKIVPAWAIRLLMLSLLVPVLLAGLDGFARARRRAWGVRAGMTTTLAAALPFATAGMLLPVARLLGVLPAAPVGPVGPGVVPLNGRGVAVLVALLLVLVVGVGLVLRSTVLGGRSRRAVDPGLAAGVLTIMSLAAVVLWAVNPFAAVAIVPALHLWLWLLDPELRPHPGLVVAALLAGLAPVALVIVDYARTLGLGPGEVVWNGMLLAAGGQLGVVLVLLGSVWCGCVVGVVAVAMGKLGQPRPDSAPVTVRGPVTYAGPGSLGGTKSALRR